ncbi:MAG TPA: hypothetical protein PLP19_22095 [bacterium]|nr:hypothetical protein [bacterium]HPN46192.1 hypothetical protein [bacterium]
MPKRMLIIFSLFMLTLVPYTHAQNGFATYNSRNHPELKWQELENEHVRIIYHQRLEATAVMAAAIAESCYGPITQNLGFTPKQKIPIYITDQDDITNGFSALDKYIGIWVNVNDYIDWTTGEDKWLRMVIGHELVHYVHFAATRTWAGIIGVGFNGTPGWFYEGMAQYESETWNVHRGDLLLRSAVMEDEMNFMQGKWPTNGGLMYAAGNSMVRYIADQYGDSTLMKIIHHRKNILGLSNYSFSGAFKKAIPNKSMDDFYREWRRHVNIYYNTSYGQKERYDDFSKTVKLPFVYVNSIQISPDKQWYGVVGLTSLDEPINKLCLVKNDSTTSLRILVQSAVNPHFSFSPDGKRLVYAQARRGRHGSLLEELFVCDLRGKSKRITTNLGASQPDWSPDGAKLVCVIEDNGTANLYTLKPDGADLQPLTHLTGDVQLLSPRWSPDGKAIAVTLNDSLGNREIALVNVENGELTYLTTDTDDNRTPVWAPDGKSLVYTGYQSDTPDIYRKNIPPDNEPPQQITDTAAGLNTAAWDGDSLLCLLTDSRRKAGVVKLDANRLAAVKPLQINPRYTSWLTHEPPHGLPPMRTASIPAAPIVKQQTYRAWRNLQHYLTVPFPVEVEDHWNIFYLSAWAEPLGKHIISAFGFADLEQPKDSRYALVYMNNAFGPAITSTLFRMPATGQVLDGKALVEEAQGGYINISWPFNFGNNLYANHTLAVQGSWTKNDPYNKEDFKDTLIPVESYKVGEFSLFYTWKRQRFNYSNTIHPKQGAGLLLEANFADEKWNSDLTYQKMTADAFVNLTVPGMGDVFYLRGLAQGANGKLPAQYFIGFDKYDQPDFGMGIKFSDRERLRGISEYMFGDRLWLATAEYRIDLIENLGWQAAGITLGRVTLAGFTDIGSLWYEKQSSYKKATIYKTYGWELKNEVNWGGFVFAHEFGQAWVWDSDDDPELYYRIRAVAPF